MGSLTRSEFLQGRQGSDSCGRSQRLRSPWRHTANGKTLDSGGLPFNGSPNGDFCTFAKFESGCMGRLGGLS